MGTISRFSLKRLFSFISLANVVACTLFVFCNILLYTGTWYLVNSYEKMSLERRAVSIKKQCTILANEIVRGGIQHYFADDSSDSAAEGKTKTAQLASDLGGRVLVIDSQLHTLADTYGVLSGQYLINEEIVHVLQGEAVSYHYVGKDYLQVMTAIRDLENGEPRGVIIALASLDDKNSISFYLSEQRDTILGIGILVTLIISIFVWFFVHQTFGTLRRPLEAIAAGHQEDLPDKGFREFVQISQAVDRMMSRSNDMERSRQEFVSNVSHELKTPITSMKILADSLLTQKDAPAELYQEFMTDIVHEIDRENQIINDLLTLVKMDKTDNAMNISAVNINEMLEILLKRVSPIAEQRGITIRLETMREVIAEVDEVKLALACNNLIVNAVKYNYDNGLVSVTLNADHKFFYIRVKDTGCGIPEDSQEMIFERFYRVDKDRSRETGGTGLGLAITRKVLLMHKGSIRVHSREGEGSTFTIRVPLNYVA